MTRYPISQFLSLGTCYVALIIGSACDKKNDSQPSTKITEEKATYSSQEIRKGMAETAAGDRLHVTIAIAPNEQTQGLSGIKPSEFSDNQAMLFWGKKDRMRSFWMPDTYFDLDIFFLDENLRVIAVERNVPHHPGRENLDQVYHTKSYRCRHVLEIKAKSPIAKKITVNSQLKWISRPSLAEIESSIRQGK